MRALVILLALVGFLGTSARTSAALHSGDAAIRAIQFVDEREGWAVGDDGVIWHSIDGGQGWERQYSGVRASLRALHFITPYTGWVVGRMEMPGGMSRGVVLVTTDGGLKWAPMSTDALPGLNCVRFFDQRNGIAAGDGSDSCPTGLFTTLDSGRTWKAIPGKRCPTWFAADFSDAETGVLGGPWSHLATLRDGLFGAAEVDPLGSRGIRSIKLNGNFAIAVGQGGLILTSSKSAGLKWGFAQPELPKEVLSSCDFESVAVQGKHLWVAGRPGTFILHSADLGQTWEFQKTGQALPLHSVYFVNENQGWAAGEMGTLLATRDGGKSWKVVRQDAQRAAVLFVHSASPALPLETVALLGEEEGYHTTALRVTCAAAPAAPSRSPEDDRPILRKIEPTGTRPVRALDPEKLSSAMRIVGGTAGESLWQFPLPNHDEGCSANQLLEHWDRLHGDRSSIQMLRQLVLAIRVWRPEVIVTDAGKGSNVEPAQAIVVAAIKEAFKQASEENAFPEQLTHLKLSLWAPKKLYSVQDKQTPEAVKIPAGEVRTRLGDCPRDYAQPAAMLLAERLGAVPNERYFSLISTRLTDARGDHHLLEGINLAPGGQARRELPPIDPELKKNQASIENAVQKRRQLESWAGGQGGVIATPEKMLAQIVPDVSGMPTDHGARTLLAVANQFVQSGQWVMAREVFLAMADKYPNHPLTLDAYRWLIRYQCSAEARRRQELNHFLNYSEQDVTRSDARMYPAIAAIPVKGNEAPAKKAKRVDLDVKLSGNGEVVEKNQTFMLRDMESSRKWLEGTLAIEPRLYPFGPVYSNDPALQFCFQSAHRQLGHADIPKKWFSQYLSETAAPLGGQTVVRGADPWRDCAMAELWLINRTIGTTPAKPIVYCTKCERKPNLDGKLDDVCWNGVQPLVLTTATGDLEKSLTKDEKGKLASEYTARAWITYDNEFMYIAVECSHPAGKRVPPVEKRDTDMDLRPYDRVSILLDLDRDYQTYFHLEIDQRGCVSDDCWGDKTWNPKWFVAIDSTDTVWTAEAAIPISELTATRPLPGNTWAVNVTRTVPGRGIQAWSTPADAKPRPEGMGLLQFISPPKRQ